MTAIGGIDYREGVKDRLFDAYLLLKQKQYGGSIYLAGRAVEGMLRGVIWQSDPEYATGRKSLETGHALRDMIKLIGNLSALQRHPLRESITSDVQKIARLWSNNMRERWRGRKHRRKEGEKSRIIFAAASWCRSTLQLFASIPRLPNPINTSYTIPYAPRPRNAGRNKPLGAMPPFRIRACPLSVFSHN